MSKIKEFMEVNSNFNNKELLDNYPKIATSVNYPQINIDITYSQEIVLCIRKGGELVAIEIQNGHLERYITSLASKGDSMHLFEVDKPKNTMKL